MARRELVELPEPQDELGLGRQQHTCANPRCDEQFFRTPGPGRPKNFHSEDCRRAAERELRQTMARLAHYQQQAEQMRARARAYVRSNFEDVPQAVDGPTDEQRQAAREAVAEARGIARFLENHQGEFAPDLLKLLRAVEPIVG